MQYSNGIATVPKDGLYYVYVQMYSYSRPGSSSYTNAVFCVTVNGSCQFKSVTYTQDYDDQYTPYIGRSLLLKKNDRLSVYVPDIDIYSLGSTRSYFGAFLI